MNNLLDDYLRIHNTNMNQLSLHSGIPESTIRNINTRPLNKWTLGQIKAISHLLRKDILIVLEELNDYEQLTLIKENEIPVGKYSIENRRYIGSKTKLLPWITTLIKENTKGESFLDIFSGTGTIIKAALEDYDTLIMNDFLHSNEVIYKAFFANEEYSIDKLIEIKEEFQMIKTNKFDDSYMEDNYGNKFFSINDAKIIGEIRERIELKADINKKEKAILIASLLYSADKISNTVGHYDAYRKIKDIEDKFRFELINPIDTADKKIDIYREDANELARKVKADITFVDPPYNSRQYSRFYHVLEVLTKWDKPPLTGVAMKPPVENVSEYSKVSAPIVFENLINNLSTNYIVVTYNNTYNPKSSSSRNKITHEEIIQILNKKGKTQVFEKPYRYFNSGKTELKDHKEMVFITEVNRNECS